MIVLSGVAVAFMLPNSGAGGTFANGSKLLTVRTDLNGRAITQAFQPNNVVGNFKIDVSASYQQPQPRQFQVRTRSLPALQQAEEFLPQQSASSPGLPARRRRESSLQNAHRPIQHVHRKGRSAWVVDQY